MSMTDYEGEYGTARVLGRPVRVIPVHDLPPHVRQLLEAVQEWAAIESEHSLDGPHPVCINTLVGDVHVGQAVSNRKLDVGQAVSNRELDELRRFGMETSLDPVAAADLLRGLR
jgi:hypothetical protein